ncbi:MAG: acyl-CoA dehydrogenase [Comamonadaceae bacterium]|nr:MAG: acyl-CoA dehydrogenase [Comamonadaceae bacterium]
MSIDSLDAFRDSARDFLARDDQRARARRLREATPAFDKPVWRAMAEAGWLSILVPETLGGLGLGLAEMAAIAETAGAELLPEPYAAGVQAVAVLAAVAALTGEVGESGELSVHALLGAAMAGEQVIGLAWQEQPGQLDPAVDGQAGLRLGAPEGGADAQQSLRGTCLYAAPGAGADGWLVFAGSSNGPCLIWMPADTPSVNCTATRRIDGSQLATLVFESAPVGAAQVLATGPSVTQALRAANDMARIAQAAELLGIARKTLSLTLDYMKTRVQFGKPIGSFQALQHRMVDAYIQVELADAVLAAAVAGEPASDELARRASRAKARCAEAALHVTQLAIQMHGAIGFTDEYDIGLYYKRALHLASWLGHASSHRRRYLALSVQPRSGEDEQTPVIDIPRDAAWDAMPDAEFRRMVRAFFRQHYPQDKRHLPRRQHWHEIKDWYLTLSRQGWIAPGWPKAFGGMGLGADKLLAFIEEQERYGVARTPDAGLTMAGPVLIRYGTPAQQGYFLPRILSGEHIWSQGYSEPNAGSDLASLRTEAVLDGDDYIVNGQKIWTTLAQDSTHIFMLVRTDKAARKQAGISFLLVDIASPGITVRVIRDLVGHEHFCEVFFDNVRVPAANLVGEPNQGWAIAKALLGFERIFLGSPKQSQNALASLHTLATAQGLFSDPVFNDRYAQLQLDVDDLSASYARFSEIVKRGGTLPPSVSLLKIWATETYRNIGQVLREAGHEAGGDYPDESRNGPNDNLLTALINSASATIYGGSNEVQRNILARLVLDMPD